MKKLGYIGKSFATGTVGIIASIVAACGGGGVTGVIASNTVPTENVLFAMAYQPTTSSDSTLKWKTAQGGNVYVGTGGDSGGNWSYGDWGTWLQADIDAKGWVGVQFKHLNALNSNDYMYYKVTGPQEGSVDISATDSLIISMTNEKYGSQANTPMEVNIFVKGGVYDANSYSYANTCKITQTLRNTTLASTYVIPLANMSCPSGTLSDLKAGVKAVEIQVLPGGGNAGTDGSTTDNYTLIGLGSVAFGLNRF